MCAEEKQVALEYVGIEAFPLSEEEVRFLNYRDFFKEKGGVKYFDALHSVSWNEVHRLNEFATVHKCHVMLESFEPTTPVDLIYYDAFGPRVQPALWTAEVFERMYAYLAPGGTLVTYCAKGSVKRAMKQVGFDVERLPGPPGKREMTRAHKR
jgi:tRNA U34 5-methylaminomethyl-2-thiouridine-forming methyltransferase MnmC